MNANGNTVQLTVNGNDYYFDSVQMSVARRVESTSLVGGGSVRVCAGGSPETVVLKGRIDPSDMFRYESLIRTLAEGIVSEMRINTRIYEGYALASGKISIEERSPYGVCELIFTEADE